MRPNNMTAYVDYFRQLAIAHTLINHNPASETGDAPPGERHFTRWNYDEVIGGLRTKVGYPCLLLQHYETVTNSESKMEVRLRPKGAFTIITSVKQGDIPGEVEAYALTEGIVYDLLKKMWQDHYGANIDICDTPFRRIDFNNINITPTGKLFQNEMGYHVEFDFEFQKTVDVTQPIDPNPTIFRSYTVLGFQNEILGL